MENNLPNRGWNAMRKILDKELPQDRKVPVFWWWTSAGVASVLLLLGVWNLSSSTLISDSINTTFNNPESEKISQPNPMVASPYNDTETSQNNTFTLDSDPIDTPIVEASTTSFQKRRNAATLLPAVRVNSSVDNTRRLDDSKEVDTVLEDMSYNLADSFLASESDSQAHSSSQIEELKASKDIISSQSNLLDRSKNDQVVLANSYASISKNIPEEETLLLEVKTPWKLNYYLNPSAGLNTINPLGFTAQFSGGLFLPLSSKWSFFSGLGLGFSELRHEANIALVQDSRVSSNSLNFDQSTFGQAIPLGSEVASVNLSSNLSAFVELGLRYEFNKWFVHTGVMFVNRFDIKEFDVMQSEFNVNGQMTSRNFTGSEIKETFVLYNPWDIRPILGMGYKLTPHYSLGLTYQHGTQSLTKYPIRRLDAVYTRSLLFGMMYQW